LIVRFARRPSELQVEQFSAAIAHHQARKVVFVALL
jgi:hypothetical protein